MPAERLTLPAERAYTRDMNTTENLTSNSPATKVFYDLLIAQDRRDGQEMPNPNGCAICQTARCQHTDN